METDNFHGDPGIVLPPGYSDPIKLVSEIHSVVKEFFWVADCYVPNFYTQNLWSRVPKTWQCVIGLQRRKLFFSFFGLTVLFFRVQVHFLL
jgi:hypothetical protein